MITRHENRSAVLALAISFLLLAISPVFGVEDIFKSWNTEDGLPQNSVLGIAQTPDGYLWLTTADGLARFDGLRFTTFKRSNTPVFPTNRLRQMFVDTDGVLWVLTEDTKFIISYSEGRFRSYRRDVDFKTDDPWAPFRDRRGMRFRHGEDAYVFRDGRFVREDANPAAIERSVAADNANRWIIIEGRYFVVEDDGTTKEVSGEGAPPETSKEIKTVQSVRLESGLWFLIPVRNYSYLCRYKDGALQTLPFKFDYRGVVGNDGSGNIWIGDYDGRLAKLPAEAQTLKDIPTSELELIIDPVSTGAPRVSAIFLDRDQNLWIGSDRGLSLLKDKALVNVFSVDSGLPSNNVYAVTEDRDGTIWFGAWELNLGSYRNGKFTMEEARLVSSLLTDDMGRLWVGYNRGIQYRDDGEWTQAVDIAADMKDGNSTFMIQTRDGAVWIGGTKSLIRYSDGEKEEFTVEDGLPGQYATAAIESRSGAIWVGTTTGLAKYESGKWSSFTEKDGMTSGFVRSLYEDQEGVLWIGTYDSGLMRFKNGEFKAIKTTDGLHGEGVFCIVEDSGWFWMSNNQGIFRIRREELNDFAEGRVNLVYSAAYGPGDGLQNVEANGGRHPAGIKASDGRLWFATAGGLAVIDPKEAYGEAAPPSALIEEVTIDQEEIPKDGPELKVNPSQNLIEINYTAFDYMYAEGMRFRYMLEGLDDRWTNAGTRRTAYFSHLPFGEYTFRVAAANRNGVWDEKGASIRIVVLRPFYRTYWFYSLLVLAAVGAFAAVYLVRVRQLKAMNDARADFTKQLIETQESERQRIALELHDSIGQSLVVIRNRALMGLNTPDKAERVLDQMQEISEASAAALQETREIAHNLHPYQIKHLGLPTALRSLVTDVGASSGIEFNTEITEEALELPEETAINIYRIAQECLNNIVRHSEAQRADLALRRTGRSLLLSIRDHGKGFDRTASRPGLGLNGISERAAMIGGSIKVESRPGKGTAVELLVYIPEPEDEN